MSDHYLDLLTVSIYCIMKDVSQQLSLIVPSNTRVVIKFYTLVNTAKDPVLWNCSVISISSSFGLLPSAGTSKHVMKLWCYEIKSAHTPGDTQLHIIYN